MDLFLPHHGNNHKAHLGKSSSLLLLSFAFVVFQVFLNFFLLARPAVLGFSSDITPERIIELTNQERTNDGLPPLKINALLSEAARQKAADMFAFNYWAHVSPSGRTPWSFFIDVGYKYQYAGENLARDFRDPQSVIKAWTNSPSHRENIVNSKYKEIGVAVVEGTLQGVETTLVVQHFGTLSEQAAARPVGNAGLSQEGPPAKPVIAEEPLAYMAEKETSAKEILANNFEKTVPLASPLDLTKITVILVVGILIGVFFTDIFLVSHRETPRFSSKSLAQMMFLLFVLLASLLMKEGIIL